PDPIGRVDFLGFLQRDLQAVVLDLFYHPLAGDDPDLTGLSVEAHDDILRRPEVAAKGRDEGCFDGLHQGVGIDAPLALEILQRTGELEVQLGGSLLRVKRSPGWRRGPCGTPAFRVLQCVKTERAGEPAPHQEAGGADARPLRRPAARRLPGRAAY